MKTLTTTLGIISKDGKVLLGMKKRGFGAGKWNGFGGKVEIETIEENMKREMKEECGLDIINMKKVGMNFFEFEGNPEVVEVHIFKIEEFSGTPEESEEMSPRWFNLNEIPFNEMWADDKHWLHLFFENKKFKGEYLFNNSNQILRKKIVEVDII
ncbi:MAG: 8-oxo-dGTP diphosphatase [Candidatus Paceibacterota bacterium]